MNNDHPESLDPEEQSAESAHLSIAHAVGLMILLIITQMLVSLLLAKIGIGETSWMSVALTHGVSGFITAHAGAILAGVSLTAILFPERFESDFILPLLIVTAGITILASELGNIMNWISPVSEEYVRLMNELFEQNRYGVLLSVGVIAPVIEELIFRGVILGGLVIRYPIAKAAWISSLLFALIHVYPWAILNAFLLGLFFVWLKIQTNALWPCILTHALYNSLPFVISGALPFEIPGFTTMPGEATQFQPLWFDAIGVLLLATGVFWIRELHRDAGTPV